MSDRLVVHDPRGYAPNVVGKRLASRPESIEGNTVYLVDCLFDNSGVFTEQLRQWFAEHLPTVNVRTIQPSKTWSDDEEMRARMAADAQAAILGVGL